MYPRGSLKKALDVKTEEWRKHSISKPSVFDVFRDYHERNFSRGYTYAASEVSISQSDLHRAVQADLTHLLNTIRLDAAVGLDEEDHTSHSILNYGFIDLSKLSVNELQGRQIRNSIKKSLLENEPRLLTDSIRISVDRSNAEQVLCITISAEIVGVPGEIPLVLTADGDLGGGKLEVSWLRINP